MVSAAVLTAAPVDAAPRPVLASALVAWLRAVSVAELRRPCRWRRSGSRPTVPATALLDWLPLTVPPEVLT